LIEEEGKAAKQRSMEEEGRGRGRKRQDEEMEKREEKEGTYVDNSEAEVDRVGRMSEEEEMS